jgi:hypothetical protein
VQLCCQQTVRVAGFAKTDELLQKIPPTHELWTNAISATKLRKIKRSNEVTKMARTHWTLVILHLVLLGVWDKGLEHQLIFSSSLHTQNIVSSSITAILTSFVTARLSFGFLALRQLS